MSEAVKNFNPSGIDFDERAKQILSSEPILAAKDVEVQFTLRGQKLTAIRKCSLELYEGEPAQMTALAGALCKRYGLCEQPRSKFARARALK